ncbi:MAG TPA: hypothetical protein HA250_01735 [Nanoarchaeota archaeon]|nr:hypothetical protein [Candidatus Pacearchaeota archaeon]HIH34001.1 hypothetical protein [Nanoarchaeota archaeon]HIH51060.1 hypothetical protein [Nanoarchaeota archaeon]
MQSTPINHSVKFFALLIVFILSFSAIAISQEVAQEQIQEVVQDSLAFSLREELRSVQPGATPDQPVPYFFDRFFDQFQPTEMVAAERAAEMRMMAERAQSPEFSEAERERYSEYAHEAGVGCVNYLNQLQTEIAQTTDPDANREQQINAIVLGEIVNEIVAEVESVAVQEATEENPTPDLGLTESLLEVSAEVIETYTATQEQRGGIIETLAEESGTPLFEAESTVREEEQSDGIPELEQQRATRDILSTNKEIRAIENLLAEAQAQRAEAGETPYDLATISGILSQVRSDLGRIDFQGDSDYTFVARASGVVGELRSALDEGVDAQGIQALQEKIVDINVERISRAFEVREALKEAIESAEADADKLELISDYYKSELGGYGGYGLDDGTIQELEFEGLSREEAFRVVARSTFEPGVNRERIQALVREVSGNPDFILPPAGTSGFRPDISSPASLARGDPGMYSRLASAGIDRKIAAELAMSGKSFPEIKKALEDQGYDTSTLNYEHGYGANQFGRIYQTPDGKPYEYIGNGLRVDPANGEIMGGEGAAYSNWQRTDENGQIKYYYVPAGINPADPRNAGVLDGYKLNSENVLTARDFSYSGYGGYGPGGGYVAGYGGYVSYADPGAARESFGPPPGSGLGGRYTELLGQGVSPQEATNTLKEEYKQELQNIGWSEERINQRFSEISGGYGSIGGAGYGGYGPGGYTGGYASGPGDASPGTWSSLVASTGSREEAMQTLINQLVQSGESYARASQRAAEAERTFQGGYTGGYGGSYGDPRAAEYSRLVSQGMSPGEAARQAYPGTQGYSGSYPAVGSYAPVGTSVVGDDGRTYTVTSDRGWISPDGMAVPPPMVGGVQQPSSTGATGPNYNPGYYDSTGSWVAPSSGGGTPSGSYPGGYYGGYAGQYGGGYASPGSYPGYSGGYYDSSTGSYYGGNAPGGYYNPSGTPSGSYPGGAYGGSYPGGAYPGGSYGGSYPSGYSGPDGSVNTPGWNPSTGTYSDGSGPYTGGSYPSGSYGGESGSYSGGYTGGSYGGTEGGSYSGGSYSGGDGSGSYSGSTGSTGDGSGGTSTGSTGDSGGSTGGDSGGTSSGGDSGGSSGGDSGGSTGTGAAVNKLTKSMNSFWAKFRSWFFEKEE